MKNCSFTQKTFCDEMGHKCSECREDYYSHEAEREAAVLGQERAIDEINSAFAEINKALAEIGGAA